ncbi:MAG TPA: YusW family protein [Bacillota bacterium]|nr:YusW family protein [Bacillota bacterium]HPZ90665.1 YusW family protein [Bacillota bacterium]HQE01539.1 YusW family protein [Bacillota bacterium]
MMGFFRLGIIALLIMAMSVLPALAAPPAEDGHGDDEPGTTGAAPDVDETGSGSLRHLPWHFFRRFFRRFCFTGEMERELSPRLPYRIFVLDAEAGEHELKVVCKAWGAWGKARVTIQNDGKEIRLTGWRAVEYLKPIFAALELDATMAEEDIAAKVLSAFAWDHGYTEFKLTVKFHDGSVIIVALERDENDPAEPAPAPDTTVRCLELEIVGEQAELEAEYEHEQGSTRAEVKRREKGEKVELEGSEAVEYLTSVLAALNLAEAMTEDEIIEAVLAAFNWEQPWKKLKINIDFADGQKIRIQRQKKDSPKPAPEPALPFRSLEVEIEGRGRELEVKIRRSNGKVEAKVERKDKKGRDFELKGNLALEYLAPRLEKLRFSPAMSRREIADAVLTAFDWEGSWEELEIKILFNDGTWLKIEYGD